MSNPVKAKAEVVEITPFGAGTYSVVLRPLTRLPRFKAGQFLHLTLDEFDPGSGYWPESRVFSIASAPFSAEIEILYSVKGRYTKRMQEELGPGSVVWLKLPYGYFTVDSALSPSQDAVLVAGGTGISPFLSYLQNLDKESAAGRRVRLYYGVRENGMVLHRELIGRCAADGKIDVCLMVESGEVLYGMSEAVRQVRGRLNIDAIREDCHGLNNPAFLISGPPQMIAAFKQKLLSAGTTSDNIKIDEWE